MNPQIVWQVWRRIMREPDLQHALFDAAGEKCDLAFFGFSDAEREAAMAYANGADRAKWFVVNYRYRLANSFLNALETGAPLVLRALLAKGFDLRILGEEFLDRHGWKDYGPYVYTYCKDALRFLSEHVVTETPNGLRHLIGLEQTVVELLISLGASPQVARSGNTLARTPNARHYRSDVRLSVWMREKKLLGKADLVNGTEHYLVFLTDLENAPKFALLPARASEIYQALAQPCTFEQLPAALERMGYAPHTNQDEGYLKVLADYCAINLYIKA